MILRSLQISEDDFQLLMGFRPTPGILIAFATLLSFLGLVGEGGNPEVVYSLAPLVAGAILGGIALTGAITSGIAAHKAGKAAKEAAKKTDAERLIEQQIAQMETGVDPAAVEATIAAGATPIGAAIGAQQTEVQQTALTAGGGAAGIPGSAISGQSAALQERIAREGSEGLAQVALGARQQQEEKAEIKEEQKYALMGQLGGLGAQRRQTVAGLKGAQVGAISGAGQAMLGGASAGAGSALGGAAFNPTTA